MESWSTFADQSIARHAHNRRLFQSTYSLTTLLSYEPYVDDCADLFCLRLAELSKSGLSIDMRHWFQCYAFDVIGMITYGKRFGFLDRGEDVGGVIEALESHLFYASTVGIYPSWHPFLSKLRNFLAGKKGSGRAYLVNFTLDRISEEIASGKAMHIRDGDIADGAEGKAESFISKFLAKNAEDPDRFTRQHIIDGCTANMVAGSDTTAISLSATLFYLLKHRECHLKLLDEIKTLTEQGLLSERPTFQETQKMPYLQAAIKEAMRVHALAGLPIERVVPEGGTVINGHHLPAGVCIYCCRIMGIAEYANIILYSDDRRGSHLGRAQRPQCFWRRCGHIQPRSMAHDRRRATEQNEPPLDTGIGYSELPHRWRSNLTNAVIFSSEWVLEPALVATSPCWK
jgi:cytochrome P450